MQIIKFDSEWQSYSYFKKMTRFVFGPQIRKLGDGFAMLLLAK